MIRTLIVATLLLGVVGAAPAAGSPYVGTFKSDEVLIEIKEVGAGQFTGMIRARGEVFQFKAREAAGALVGAFTVDQEAYEFRATLSGATLTWTTEDGSYVLTKQGADVAAPGQRTGSAASRGKSTASASQARPLRVNRVTIDEEQLRKFEREHKVLVPRGEFWYDKISGGWGVEGGPTLGFTTPGMDLGGPLPADASRGDTGVFVNGRELPVQDVLGLQRLNVPVQRGRWWIDFRGNFGIEGNPTLLGNIFQFSRGQGGAYQRATAGGYIGGDGQTSYFFDPQTGSSVMTGQ